MLEMLTVKRLYVTAFGNHYRFKYSSTQASEFLDYLDTYIYIIYTPNQDKVAAFKGVDPCPEPQSSRVS